MNEPEPPDDEAPPAPSLIERFPALARLTEMGRRRIPVVLQLAGADCGAACLSMVLGYHGKNLPLDEVRHLIGVDREGASAKAILDAAEWLGLRGRGVRIDIDQLDYLDPGSILHWDMNHFVVFERLVGDDVEIVDPAFGRRRLPMADFGRSFTGVALLLEPGEAFLPGGDRKNSSLRYLRQVFRTPRIWSRLLVTSLLLQLFALAAPALTGTLVDRVVPRGDQHLLTVLAVGLAALVGFDLLATLVRSHLLLHLRTQVDAQLTLGFLEHLIELPFAWFQQHSAGDLIMRLNSNATIREILTSGVISTLLDGALVILYLALAFVVSPGMATLAGLLGLGQVLVMVLAWRRQRELMGRSLSVQVRAESYQVEMLSGIETLKAMGGERRAVQRFSDLFVDVLNVSLARGRLTALTDAVTSTLRIASPLALLVYGALGVLRGELSLGTMLAVNSLAAGFLAPLASLVSTGSQLQLLGSYVERLDEVFDTAPEQDARKVRRAGRLQGGVRLDRVSFRYGPLRPLVVQEVSLEVKPGQMVALVGASGSGKSTLAALLAGLYRPTEGRILFDGADLGELDLRSVRRQLGIVTQRPYVFAGTIRSNVAAAEPDMSLERVMAAANVACLHDEILAMGLGYDTILADGGSGLSGGQRQRLALARAVAGQPVLLLLDEATSALDSLLERRVQAALAKLRCTQIVIAHRLSTIFHADLILVMDQGSIVEQGTHDELLRQGGLYARMVAAQQAQSRD